MCRLRTPLCSHLRQCALGAAYGQNALYEVPQMRKNHMEQKGAQKIINLKLKSRRRVTSAFICIKAIPHNSGVRIAQQDFSSGCTNKSR